MSLYDRFCAAAYARARAWLAPGVANSQYLYADALRSALNHGEGRWLDLGCGHDFLPSWMAGDSRQLPLRRWNAVGIDLDASAVQRHAALKLRILGNIERLPFHDGAFNLVTANMVLEHVRQPGALFAEIGRVLSDGGVLLIHTPNAAGYTTRLSRLIPGGLIAPLAGMLLGRKQEDVYPAFYRANSVAALEAAARGAGLDVDRIAYVHSSPQLIRVPPLMCVELALTRLTNVDRFTKYRVCILATFRKPRRA
jgi:SAM-dependent methyltransferase